MIKVLTIYENINIDIKVNVNGELSRRLIVNFDNNPNDYYRIGEFLEFAERKLLSMKYGINFDEENMIDISNHITSVCAVEETSKYGVKNYLLGHFDIGYDFKIDIKNADFKVLSLYFNKKNNESSVVTSPQQNKQIENKK